MPIIRIFKCDICNVQEQEAVPNGGVMGWAQFSGIELNGVGNPMMCPDCKEELANIMDSHAEANK